jgi:hypothetical protein
MMSPSGATGQRAMDVLFSKLSFGQAVVEEGLRVTYMRVSVLRSAYYQTYVSNLSIDK